MLAEALQSVAAQTRAADEVVVLDDASTDDTPRAMEAAAAADPRIRYVRLEQNVGLGGALQAAYENSHGDVIAFLDSDDIWELRHLEVCLDAMESRRVVLVFGRYGLIDADGLTLRSVVREPYLSRTPFEDLLYKRLVVTPSRCVIRRFAIEEAGGIPPIPAMDWALHVLIAGKHPEGVVQLAEKTALMRMHRGQSYGRLRIMPELIAATEYIFDRLPPDLADLKPRVIAINCLHSAVFHWQACRYRNALICMRRALLTDPSSMATTAFLSAIMRLMTPPQAGRLARAVRYRPSRPIVPGAARWPAVGQLRRTDG